MNLANAPSQTEKSKDSVHVAAPAARYVKIALFTLAAAGIAYLLTRHAGHTLRLLPYLILVACPLMHFMHHGRHGRHG
jgi:ABC-type xylose transport system permease subunit